MKTGLLILLLLLVLAVLALALSRLHAQAPAASEAADPGKAAVERAREDVEKFGWHMVMIQGKGRPGFLFTIGLWKTYKQPEILLFAPSEDPSGMAGRLSAVVKRVIAGESLKNGTIAQKAFGDYDGEARDVLRQWYPSFLGTAGAFYGNFDFPAVQLYWPDKAKLFPWQSGFNPQLFQHQPILYQDNLVLANVGYAEIQQIVHDEGPGALEASLADLFVTPDDAKGDLIGDWRWRVGPTAQPYQVTLFGDLFLKTSDGHIHWLDAGSDIYDDVAADRESWLRALCDHVAAFFHPSTLLHFRSLGYLPKKGQVYSWIKPPLVGGADTVDNFDAISTVVHISHHGRWAQAVAAKGTEAHGAVPEDDKTLYTVVINDEKQYSIWPTGRELPSGWKSVGKTGTKKECVDYISKVWVDLRPESLRRKRQEEKEHP